MCGNEGNKIKKIEFTKGMAYPLIFLQTEVFSKKTEMEEIVKTKGIPDVVIFFNSGEIKFDYLK